MASGRADHVGVEVLDLAADVISQVAAFGVDQGSAPRCVGGSADIIIIDNI
jgi:hypothetical protein